MTHPGKKIETWIYELHEKPIHPFSFPLFACFLFSRPLVVLSQRGEWHRLMAAQSHGYIIPLTAHLTCIFEDHGRKRCNSETSFTSKTIHHTKKKNNILSKMIADSNQKVLKTSKASWRVSTNTPSSARGEYGRLVVKDNKWAHWTTTVASAPLLSKCGPHSKPEESSMALIKQLPCHGANSTFESCWPAGWTILENKLDPSVPERWPTAAGWGRFPGIYPQKSLEQMVPFRKPSITALKSRISRCSGGGPCPKGETPDPESPLNRPIWLKGRRFRHGSRGLMQ